MARSIRERPATGRGWAPWQDQTRGTVGFVEEKEPIGGVEWSTFSWRKQWYPMAFEKVTDKSTPSRLEIMGDPIVLWFDHIEDEWRAMLDECPHRMAPLSEGRVT